MPRRYNINLRRKATLLGRTSKFSSFFLSCSFRHMFCWLGIGENSLCFSSPVFTPNQSQRRLSHNFTRYLHKYIRLAHKHTKTATRWMPKRPNGDKHKRYYLHLWKTPRHTCWLRWCCRRRLCCWREWDSSTVGDGSYTRYHTVNIAQNSGSEGLFNCVGHLYLSKVLLLNVPWYWLRLWSFP